ncbi:FtsX-like permease family protein [Sulfurospirillum sp. 1612]|uniref:FtsX-like permease family protein n=1 Tax=Sulfurospirillum sp. 1612 TaxID=3094835 RepID=UPI002F95D81B
MKSLKNHISVILSLFVLLLSVESSIVIDKIIKGQDKKMLSSYSIVVVSNKTLQLDDIQKQVSEVASISTISSEKILDKLKNDMTADNLALLKIALPHFYSLKLNVLPTKDRLERIKKVLLSSKSISKVEVFSKTYENIFQVLRILQLITYAFSGIIILISILLLFKQIRIWILEHEEKMQIMSYFGATFWMKSAFLYKLVLIDSLISSVFVVGCFELLQRSTTVRLQLSMLDIDFPSFSMLHDGGLLFAISLVFSLVIVTFVSMKMSD